MIKIKNIAILILCFSFICILLYPNYACTNITVKAESKAEIVIEHEFDYIFHESNADTKLPMASTTKIITAITVIEDCNLDEIINVDARAIGIEGSSIYLTAQETISVRDLLYGLMLQSGNDAAAALAIHHSGSIEAFVKAINKRAIKIGAHNTNFTNPSGLPNDNHYTTARDLAKIAAYAMRNQNFKKIVSTQNYQGQFKSFSNKNKILKMVDGANGVKTGFTVKAGRCLVSSAEKNGLSVICVVLNCTNMFERSKTLLENALNNYKIATISKDKLFYINNKIYKLNNDKKFIVKNDCELRFKISEENGEKNNVKEFLNIYDKNNLIFSENLYTI